MVRAKAAAGEQNRAVRSHVTLLQWTPAARAPPGLFRLFASPVRRRRNLNSHLSRMNGPFAERPAGGRSHLHWQPHLAARHDI